MQNLTFFLHHLLQYFQLVDMRHTRINSDSVVLYQNQEKIMRIFYKTAGKLMVFCLFALLITGCNREAVISFSQDVNPILAENCLQCHQAGGSGLEASGFSMESYEDLMKGTNFGPMIIAGDAEGSNMLVLMEGRADPSISMPHGEKDPISKQDIQTIRLWIEQGAKNN
jgi:hypothetical protein